jgi:hypothetical protein
MYRHCFAHVAEGVSGNERAELAFGLAGAAMPPDSSMGDRFNHLRSGGSRGNSAFWDRNRGRR